MFWDVGMGKIVMPLKEQNPPKPNNFDTIPDSHLENSDSHAPRTLCRPLHHNVRVVDAPQQPVRDLFCKDQPEN